MLGMNFALGKRVDNMKFLILGGTGMAGHTIALYLQERGHDVTTLSKNHFPYCKGIIGNALDSEHLAQTIEDTQYDIIVNCIGLLNQDCDKSPSKAILLNSYLPHYIAEIAKSKKCKIIHMSTDCVFSGKTGPYHEGSFRDGESFYDRTKALGELDDSKNLTFRNSIVGPDMKEEGIGLFNWFMKQNGVIHGYTNAIWTGVTTITLAKAIETVAVENLSGIYNLVNNQSISKFDLLRLFNKHFRNNEIKINPDHSVNIDKTLVNNRKDFSFIVPTYEEMIIEMKEWIYEHKYLYKHYF